MTVLQFLVSQSHRRRTYFWFRARGHRGEDRRHLQAGEWEQSQCEHLTEEEMDGVRTGWDKKK